MLVTNGKIVIPEINLFLYSLESVFCSVTQVSYAATAPTLSNREDFPYFYRTIMPDSSINAARVALMQKYNWTRVGTIHGKHEIFSLVSVNYNA